MGLDTFQFVLLVQKGSGGGGGARWVAKRCWVMVARQERGIGWKSHKCHWPDCKFETIQDTSQKLKQKQRGADIGWRA